MKDDRSDTGASLTSFATSTANDGVFASHPYRADQLRSLLSAPSVIAMVLVSVGCRGSRCQYHPSWCSDQTRRRRSIKEASSTATSGHMFASISIAPALIKNSLVGMNGLITVKQNHWAVYCCPFGCDLEFSSAEQCREHLYISHDSSAEIFAKEMETLVKRAAGMRDFEATNCVLLWRTHALHKAICSPCWSPPGADILVCPSRNRFSGRFRIRTRCGSAGVLLAA